MVKCQISGNVTEVNKPALFGLIISHVDLLTIVLLKVNKGQRTYHLNWKCTVRSVGLRRRCPLRRRRRRRWRRRGWLLTVDRVSVVFPSFKNDLRICDVSSSAVSTSTLTLVIRSTQELLHLITLQSTTNIFCSCLVGGCKKDWIFKIKCYQIWEISTILLSSINQLEMGEWSSYSS